MADIHWNGRDYPLVPIDQVTIDEAILIERYSGVTMDRIPEMDNVTLGVVKALIHISVARVEVDESEVSIGKAVGRTPYLDLQKILLAVSEEVDDESVPPPNATSSDASSTGSGGSSEPTGEPAPDSSPENGTGSRGSATGAISGPATWGR